MLLGLATEGMDKSFGREDVSALRGLKHHRQFDIIIRATSIRTEAGLERVRHSAYERGSFINQWAKVGLLNR